MVQRRFLISSYILYIPYSHFKRFYPWADALSFGFSDQVNVNTNESQYVTILPFSLFRVNRFPWQNVEKFIDW